MAHLFSSWTSSIYFQSILSRSACHLQRENLKPSHQFTSTFSLSYWTMSPLSLCEHSSSLFLSTTHTSRRHQKHILKVHTSLSVPSHICKATILYLCFMARRKGGLKCVLCKILDYSFTMEGYLISFFPELVLTWKFKLKYSCTFHECYVDFSPNWLFASFFTKGWRYVSAWT